MENTHASPSTDESSSPINPHEALSNPVAPISPEPNQLPKKPKSKKSKNTPMITLVIFTAIALVLFFANGKKETTQTSLPKTTTLEESSDKAMEKETEVEENEDYFYEAKGTLPLSKSFSAKVIGADRLLKPKDGFGSEVIAIGSDPLIYNFSILKPLDWQRSTLETTRYSSSSPDKKSTLGVLHTTKDRSHYQIFDDCRSQVERIFEAQPGVEAKIKSETDAIVDGKKWDRVAYDVVVSETKQVVSIGMDQCYKTADDLFTVYVLLTGDSITEHRANQEKILDDFWLVKL